MSIRILVVRSSFASAASAAQPCPRSPIRVNRRHVIESLTCWHRVTYPSPYRNFKNTNRHIAVHRRGRATHPRVEERHERREEHGEPRRARLFQVKVAKLWR